MRIPKALLLLPPVVATQKQCYRLDGTEADSSFAPCEPNAEVSGCCQTNKGAPDICLSSGLCLSTQPGHQGLIYSNGCTDKTGKDPACPHACPDDSQNSIFSYNVVACAPGGKICCRPFGDDRNCCDDVLTFAIGSVMTVSTSAATTTSVMGVLAVPSEDVPTIEATTAVCADDASVHEVHEACPKHNSVIIGSAIGGSLGAALLGSLAAIAVLLMKRRKESPDSPQPSSKHPTSSPRHELPQADKTLEMYG